MIEQPIIEHRIQRHIIGVLMYQRVARFRDLRPPRTDTNLFSYHLKALLSRRYVEKTSEGYRLSRNGLMYVDRVSTEKMNIRSQPKIISMLFVQDGQGRILLQKRTKQPYIDAWTLPYGKVHIDDSSVLAAASREAQEKLSITTDALVHSGDYYIRAWTDGVLLSSTLAHVCRLTDDGYIIENETLRWADPARLEDFLLAPAVAAIVDRTLQSTGRVFAEFDENWYN